MTNTVEVKPLAVETTSLALYIVRSKTNDVMKMMEENLSAVQAFTLITLVIVNRIKTIARGTEILV